MIRILHVVPSLMQRSGVTSVIMTYYRAIDKNKIQFDFLVNKAESELFNEIIALGGRVFFFPRLTVLNYPQVTNAVRSFFVINGSNFTAVHSHYSKMDFIVLRYAKQYNIKHRISHSHSTSYTDGGRLKTLRNWIMHCLGKKYVTDYFACGKEAGRFLFGDKRESDIYVMHNAKPLEQYIYNEKVRLETRKEKKWSDCFIVGCVGSYNVGKNQSYLIRLLPELLKKKPNIKLILIGDGPERMNLEKLINELNVENNCELIGVSSEVSKYLQAFDCYALPSKTEGLGLSVIEAQISGLKCILSTDIPKEVNILNKCIFCDLSDAEEWIRQIIGSEIQNRQVDKAIIDKAGYNIEIEAKRLERKYESMAIKAKE